MPVESKLTEYIDRFYRDSIHLYDSVFVREKGDTFWLEKYRYLYQDRIIRDSIFKVNSIAIPYPVEVIVFKNDLKSWQKILIGTGGVSLLGLALMLYFKFK